MGGCGWEIKVSTDTCGALIRPLDIKDNLGDRIVGVETADKMTDPQIVAKVKEYFLHQSAAAGSRESNFR